VRDSSSGKRDGIARAAGRPLAGRAAAVGLFAVIVAFTVHNATDDLFVHSMELQFALYLAILLARQPHAADAT
jgi:hypothetical protein